MKLNFYVILAISMLVLSFCPTLSRAQQIQVRKEIVGRKLEFGWRDGMPLARVSKPDSHEVEVVFWTSQEDHATKKAKRVDILVFPGHGRATGWSIQPEDLETGNKLRKVLEQQETRLIQKRRITKKEAQDQADVMSQIVKWAEGIKKMVPKK